MPGMMGAYNFLWGWDINVFAFFSKYVRPRPLKKQKILMTSIFCQPTWILALLGLIKSFFRAFFSF